MNERDGLGDDLVPDYTTSVKENGFYGWPYAYFGPHKDTASLGIAFNDKNYFSSNYNGGLFVAQHGSWNRSVLTGYKVVFVPFKNGKP